MKISSMRKSSFLCVGMLFSVFSGNAQTTSEPIILNEPATVQPAQTTYVPFTAGPITVFDERDNASFTITPTDELTMQNRLLSIQNIMPFTYNETVRQFIDFFMYRRPSFTRSMLEKKDVYFPIFEQYLAKYQMPDELKYLALIESGLNPKAVSRASAVGLWQFMSPTGREHGLQIDEFIDERMHIEKSTDAACRYLRTLYRMFNNWDLALAAYNTGPGNIKRALRRSGKTDYWDIHPFIHRDTRTYVPQFIAIAYMMNYGPLHGIMANNPQSAPNYKVVHIDGYMDLKKLAELGQLDFSSLQSLNPHIRKDILPAYTRQFELRLPTKNYEYFAANQQNILAEAGRPYVPPTQPDVIATTSGVVSTAAVGVAAPILNASVIQTAVVAETQPQMVIEDVEEERTPQRTSSRQTSKTKREIAAAKPKKRYHKVGRGENLTSIANRYDVRLSDLKEWNNLRSSRILVGQRLAVFSQAATPTEIAVSTKNNRQRTSDLKKVVFHTVKPGDTLWNISQRYDGVTINDIKRMNGLNGNTLKVGQRLKISS